LTLFDYVALGILGLSVVIGLLRGAVREVLALASWVVAFIVARAFVADAAPLLPHAVSSPAMRTALAFIALFIVTLILVSLASVLLSTLLKKIGLGPLDRLLGALLGLLRGIAIALVLVLLAGLTALPQQPLWRKAVSSAWFESMANWAKPWLPDGIAKRIHFDGAES
jgi:membrane protein required for colicin V production